jgi:hypothetical protein
MGPVERKGAPRGRRHGRRFAAWLIALLAAGPLQGQTLGTSFTYQGRLTDAGTPANGAYDLRFTLFDAASGGAQVGTTLTRDDVAVANGLFTVSLDFGTVFAGTALARAGRRPGTPARSDPRWTPGADGHPTPSSPRPPPGRASRASRPASRTTRTTTRSADCPARTARSRSGTAPPGLARPTPTAEGTSRASPRARPSPAAARPARSP